MSHWLLDTLGDKRAEALLNASKANICNEFTNVSIEVDFSLIKHVGEMLELTVLDLLLDDYRHDDNKWNLVKSCASDAFKLFRVLPNEADAVNNAMFLLRSCSLAVLGDMRSDAARLLIKSEWTELPIDSDNWKLRTWSTVLDIWLRLIRKKGWQDRDIVLERIVALRESQVHFEKDYLGGLDTSNVKPTAIELLGLYHLTKAAEIFALFMTDGVVEDNYQIHQLLDTQFDRVLDLCKFSQMVELEPLTRLLAASSLQMADNSIWTVTRAVNSRVTKFVKSLVDRGRGNKAIFELLPPQRKTLAEQGLLGSSRRAVVVSLPTSSGKTLIAQFRILQALNQFDNERGWVAYLVPTRTLVNQITRQLRKDFSPLGIIVEQVSPALEIDSIEEKLLNENSTTNEFNVLVTTPEKLDLLLRKGLEQNIGRPLTLVIVDEAHNIQGENRGLKLELLLATINNECRNAQFLLLTPFISNAKEVARWLGGQNSDVAVSLEWQANDRVIGIVKAERAGELENRGFDYFLKFETVHTSRDTIAIDDFLTLPKNNAIASTYSKTSSASILAAIVAQQLHQRGPIIIMHTRPDWVWTLAEKLKIDVNKNPVNTDKIKLVKQFLEFEFGHGFALVELLDYGIGVHHAGLSDEIRSLMEWLFSENELKFLVATTTIAQGVNFPVSGVVMASHQYPYGKDMPPEDFWNIAGRAGRIDQGYMGVVALVAEGEEKAQKLKQFINYQTGELNSALIAMAQEAADWLDNLGEIVFRYPEWSAFVQYLSHTYSQMGNPSDFADRIEQILRGTFGFEKLKLKNMQLANKLLSGIREYIQYIQEPGQPLKLVDSTGFSLQSIKNVFSNASESKIDKSSWNSDTLFSGDNQILQRMMGVLLRVPELRKNFEAVLGGKSKDGKKLALIIKDWVNGQSIHEIAERHFMRNGDDITHAITNCGKSLFGALAQTASWGLGALLSITGSELSEDEIKELNNLPSKVYYGVNDDSAVALRLLGIPRTAAAPLANAIGNVFDRPLGEIREELMRLDENKWTEVLGTGKGNVYRSVWRVIEGLELS